MKRLEVITLRHTRETEQDKVIDLLHQVRTLSPANIYEIKLYRHSELDNDLSIHLRWINDGSGEQKSTLGQQLVHELREFGLVHRAVWIEETLNDHE